MQAFAIRNKTTGEWWKARSSKMLWTTIGAAKIAWNQSHYLRNTTKESRQFDNQTEYEIVRLIPEN